MNPVLDSLRQRARRLKRDTYALYLAYRHPRTPWYARVVIGVVVAYALSPIDLIPDFVPVLGYLDDLLLVPLGLAIALRLVPTEVMAECRARAEELARQGQLESRAAAVVIVVIWAACVALAIALLIRWRAG